MKAMKIYLSVIVCLIVMASCRDSHKEAKEYLQDIHNLYNAGKYDLAKQRIDSIQVLYPKAFDQIREGLALLQDVRKAQDKNQITFCDSALAVLTVKIDSVKQNFSFEKDKEYEEYGRFVPKYFPAKSLSGTLLRSGVGEDGYIYIESVYLGSQYHNMLRIQTKDGTFAETLPVDDDGMNFRFSNLGKQYEIIKFSRADENGLSRFIYANADKPLTVTLKGKNTYSYTLTNNSKRAISDSYQLSLLMLQADSLKNVKEVSLARLEYLNRKQQPDSISGNK